jgi:enediyne biosynthesis protein E4
VSNYIRFSFERAPVPGANSNCNWKGIPVVCGPRGLPKGRHALYRNNGDGTFTDVSERAGITQETQSYGMTVVAADLDEDGWTDIYVACDSTPSLLFMNNHDGTFREEGVLRGVALSDDGGEQAGMGVGIGDYDVDGHLDLLKTHFADDASGLYQNDGTGNFDDVTRASRVAVETRYVGWGAGIVDLDNDGWPDLFVVTGNVYPEVEQKLPEYPNKSPRTLFRNLGKGSFEQIMGEAAGPGVSAAHCSRGCAFGDFDNDGDVDVLIVNLNEAPSLLRNDVTGSHNWAKLKLEGVKSNRSAIGARVVVRYGERKQAQAVVSQSSYYSSNDPRLHFGLGANVTAIDVDVHWPSGLHETFTRLPVNGLITLREGVGPVPNRGWGK